MSKPSAHQKFTFKSHSGLKAYNYNASNQKAQAYSNWNCHDNFIFSVLNTWSEYLDVMEEVK
jgi:hypothetical protein